MSQEVKKEQIQPKQNMRYQRDKDKEKVRGIFRFNEVPGGAMEFVYKAYKGDDVERFLLVDGHTYEIPLGVAKHLNKNGWYPEYGYIQDSSGIKTVGGAIPTGQVHSSNLMKVTKKVRRFSFQSLEFVDVDDLPTDVVSVEKV
jgi:hypothetical protein